MAVNTKTVKTVKTFVRLEEFGSLAVERTLILNQRPTCFLCSNGKCHFLFYEVDYERDSTQWLVVPVKTYIAKGIILGEITIQSPFRMRECRSSDKVFLVHKDGKSIDGRVKEATAADLASLPKKDLFRLAG